jgi:hypothetical protein
MNTILKELQNNSMLWQRQKDLEFRIRCARHILRGYIPKELLNYIKTNKERPNKNGSIRICNIKRTYGDK